MKKIISLAIVVCAVFILISCEDKDEVADEIVDYYNDEWAAINNTLQKEMRNSNDEMVKLEKEDKTDEAANIVKEEMMPVVDEVLKQYKSVDPPNKKVKKLNDMQIEIEEFFNESLEEIIIYYESSGDVSDEDLKEKNKELKKKQGDALEYRDELMEEYELEEVEDDDDEDKRFPEIERAKE